MSGRFQGQLDEPLDVIGRSQAAAVGTILGSWNPARVVTSDLGRAVDTGSPLAAAGGVVLETDPRLREIYLGEWQGLTRDEAAARFPTEYEEWIAGRDVRRGGGETLTEVADRVTAALTDALEGVPDHGLVVVVTHGATARAALGRLLEVEPDRWWRLMPLGNTRWSVVLENARGWRLAEHNAGLVEPLPRISAPDAEPVVSS